MFGTWGYQAFRKDQLEDRPSNSFLLKPQTARNRSFIAQKLNQKNHQLSLLGYVPGVSMLSSLSRISAAVNCLLRNKQPDSISPLLEERWQKALRGRAKAQLVRGLLEFSQVGIGVNIGLGVFGSLYRGSRLFKEGAQGLGSLPSQGEARYKILGD
ncbi:MAG: hypothetical protein K0S07_361 [Chlamydiales bacterium]|nr:hypothetical protein [Chlamydiales bacterium]